LRRPVLLQALALPFEARQLLKTSGAAVTTVAYEVGYESTSQFSREYARKFVVPPSHDTAEATDDARNIA
jgi:transcriptional regulator GlxA family with amidase domain